MTNWGAPQPGPQLPHDPNQPVQPGYDSAPQLAHPVHGAWTGAWQDERGQWHYPYAVHAPAVPPAPPALPAQPVQPPPAVVPAAALEPVGPPRYHAAVAAPRDPRRTTMAAAITFVSLVIALWAMLGFMGSMADTLSSILAGTNKLKAQLGTANEGMAKLETKTGHLNGMADESAALETKLAGIDSDMGAMVEGVNRIGEGMQAMDTSLTNLDSQLTAVNDINQAMAGDLAKINNGLGQQKANVARMRRDVDGTATVLGTIPGRLKATNGRLKHTNGVVNYMGCQGILNNLQVKIFLGPINNGSAKVVATVVPPGAWGTKADGSPC